MCTIDGCENPVAIKSRGWCNKHYLRWRTHGDPEVMKRGGAEKCKLDGCESSVHEYGVSATNVRSIVKRKTWRHI